MVHHVRQRLHLKVAVVGRCLGHPVACTALTGWSDSAGVSNMTIRADQYAVSMLVLRLGFLAHAQCHMEVSSSSQHASKQT
jgi:hypothetical protein